MIRHNLRSSSRVSARVQLQVENTEHEEQPNTIPEEEPNLGIFHLAFFFQFYVDKNTEVFHRS